MPPTKHEVLDLRLCKKCGVIGYYQAGCCLNPSCELYQGKCNSQNQCAYAGYKTRKNWEKKQEKKRGSKGQKRRLWWQKHGQKPPPEAAAPPEPLGFKGPPGPDPGPDGPPNAGADMGAGPAAVAAA